MKYNECHRCSKVVVPILFVGNCVLALFKTVVGIVGNSSGLIADGAHSATDAISALILFLGMRFTEKPADDRHPFGHRNFEFILAKIVSIFLFLVGLYILFSSIYKLYKGVFVTPEYVTLVAAIMSILANVVMSRYGTCVGKQMNSPAILTVAYEIKADAMSSVAISIGIIGAELGYPILDPIAAGIVALIIIKNSIHLLMDAMDGLMDSAVEENEQRKIKNIIERHPEVRDVDFLRSRRTGRYVSIEAGIMIDAHKNIDEGDSITREIRGDLINLVDNMKDVDISISSGELIEDDIENEIEDTINEEIVDDDSDMSGLSPELS